MARRVAGASGQNAPHWSPRAQNKTPGDAGVRAFRTGRFPAHSTSARGRLKGRSRDFNPGHCGNNDREALDG